MTKATYRRRLKRLIEFEEFLECERKLESRMRSWEMYDAVRKLWYIMDDEPVELPEVGRFNRWGLIFNTPEGHEGFEVYSRYWNSQTRTSERTQKIPLIDLIRFIKRKAKKDFLSCA